MKKTPFTGAKRIAALLLCFIMAVSVMLPITVQDPQTGELTGALKDFLELASHSTQNAGIEFEAVPLLSPTDSLDMLMSGKVDCLFPTAQKP